MSMVGSRTGWDYHTDRVQFLRQMYSAETRQRAVDQLSPRGAIDYRRMPNAGIAPGFATAYMRMHTAPLAHLRPRPIEPLPETAPQATPAVIGAVERPLTPRNRIYPAVSTSSQMAYGAHDPAFLNRFRTETHEFGKMKDTTTHFRENVFNIWNISGTKAPAVFR